MKADSDVADATTWISMLKKLFITTPDPTREGDDNASPDIAVPRTSQEHRHHLKTFLPDTIASNVKERQCPSDLSPPRDAKRVYSPRGNRLRGNAKSTLLTLPVELRLVIIRMVLGDRKVHVHYKRGLHSDPSNDIREVNKL